MSSSDIPAPERPSARRSGGAALGNVLARLNWAALVRVLTALGIALLLWVGLSSALVPPRVVVATAPETEFSAERAMEHVRMLAQRPGPTGSEESERRRGYLVDQLTALGLGPEIDTATGISTLFPVAGTIHNVLARIPGSGQGQRAVLLMAHYDVAGVSPGAGDDVAGVAAILETLRALRAGPPLRNDVIVLLTDGEESGLLGAAAFVSEHPWARRADVVFNFEARGTRGPSLMFETAEGNAEVVRAFARHVPHATGSSFMYSVYQRMPNDTDFSELRRLGGTPGLNFAFIGGVRNYHTPRDDVDNLDPRSVQHHGYSALAMARHFGDAELPLPRAGDVVFFNLPPFGLLTYPIASVPGFSLLLGLLGTGALAAGFLFGILTSRGFAFALGGMLLAVLLASALATGIGEVFFGVHRTLANEGRPRGSVIYAAAIIAAALAAFALVLGLLRRWTAPPELLAGAMVIWAALAIASGEMLPGGSYIFQWPAIASAVLLLVLAATPSGRVGDAAREVALWTASAATILLLAPLIALVFQGLQLQPPGVAAIALLTVLTAALHPLHLDRLQGRRPGSLGAVFGALALLLAAVGLATIRYSPENPRPNQILYLLNAEQGVAAWAAPALRPDDWTAQFLGNDPASLDRAGLARAGFPMIAWGSLLHAEAPLVDLAPPEVFLLADQTGSQGRIVLLEVRPPVGARSLAFHKAGGGVIRATVEGRRIETERYRFPTGDWNLTFVSPSAEGIHLSLLLHEGTDLDLYVAAAIPGLPQVPGLSIRPRPEEMMPFQDGDFTWVSRRFSF